MIRKKSPILLLTLSGISVCFLVLVVIGMNTITGNTNQKRIQEDLAKQLGVKIGDYPYESSFPEGYFYTVLKPGMTINEVHQIVQGYEKVLHCEDIETEIYYYFSSEDEIALRFAIIYDDQWKFWRLRGEDTNSPSIRIEGCKDGPIRE